jgi:hypothetical protein
VDSESIWLGKGLGSPQKAAGTLWQQYVVLLLYINALDSILQMRTNHVLSLLHTAAGDSLGDQRAL